MVSKYDVFYVIATKGETKVHDIVEALHKPKEEYRSIFNHVMELYNKDYITKDTCIKIVHNEKSKKLFKLISFCINNRINYNLLFKKTMLKFLEKAAKKEFFTIKDVNLHPLTFNLYVNALAKYGFLLILSRKPFKCKLLRHHFLINLTSFFGINLIFYEPKQHSFISEIKQELSKYKRSLKIHYTVVEELETKEEVNFIYSSLNLEGNPLTLPETQKLIMDEIVPEKHKLIHIQEVTNYKKAVDLMMVKAKMNAKLDLQLILEYHNLAMSHINGSGEIRKQNVRIKLNPSFKTCDWQLIPQKLNKLMRLYHEFESEKKDIEEIIGFASYFHNEFQRIHPFIDGNSRTSRLLMLHILRKYGFPVLDLPIGYFDLYMNLTKGSIARNDKAFRYLIEEIVFMNLKKMNSML